LSLSLSLVCWVGSFSFLVSSLLADQTKPKLSKQRGARDTHTRTHTHTHTHTHTEREREREREREQQEERHKTSSSSSLLGSN